MIDEFIFKILRKVGKDGAVRFTDLLNVVSNPRTLSKKLEFLISKGLVKIEGRLYMLTEKGEIALKLLEKLTAIVEDSEFHVVNIEKIPHGVYSKILERYCKILYEHFGTKLLGIALFGSIARGDWNKNSDIDLLVIVEEWDKKPVWERIRELLKLKKKLRETEEYKRAVRKGYFPIIQHYPLSRKEALEFHRIYIDMCLDGIILYERDKFLTKIIEKVRQKLLLHGAKRITIPGKGYYWILADLKAGEVIEF